MESGKQHTGEKKFLKCHEVAKILGVSRPHIDTLVTQGVLKARDLNKGMTREDGSPARHCYRFLMADVQEFIDQSATRS